MSAQLMKSTQENERNHRSSSCNSDQAISRPDDTSFEMVREPSLDYCQRMDNCYTLCPSDDRRSFQPRSPDATGFQLDEHLAFYLSSPDDELRPNAPTRTKTSNSKQTRNNSELDQRSSRRSSVQSSRSRTNSCSRPTSLGNGRRSSSSRRTKTRRGSTPRRKDSVRPLKTEAKDPLKVLEDARTLEQARRHRRIAMIVLGTFLFLLAASILVVVVTLTHSTFLSPAAGSKELAEHRAQTAQGKRGIVEFAQPSFRNRKYDDSSLKKTF